MLVNLIENLKHSIISKFVNYNATFLAGFPKQVADTFRLKNMNRAGGQINRLIKMENLDLIVSPSKLFEGKSVPRTSEQKPKNAYYMKGDDKENSLSHLSQSLMEHESKNRRYSTISSKTK